MEEKKIKESIDLYIGKEKLYTNQFRNRLLSNKFKSKPSGLSLFNNLKPVLALVLLIVGGMTYFILSYDFNKPSTTANKEDSELVEKPIVEEPESEPIDPTHIFVELNNHGKPFPNLEDDLRNVMLTPNADLGILKEMINSINGVSIDEQGRILVEFKDFRNKIPSPSTELTDLFLGTLYDTIFKYPEVKSADFSFDGNLTAWDEWVEPASGLMLRQYVFDLNTHGKPFPELENDLNNLMSHGYAIDELNSRNVDVLANSVNGVSINDQGTVVVEFKDFRNEFGSLTTNEKGEFLWPLYDTVFKYPEVKEVYFTFDSSFNAWYEWLEYTPDPMIRQTEQVPDNTSRLLDNLLTTHSNYNDMYQTLLDAEMPNEHAAAIFILYIEALRNNDVNEASRYSMSTDSEIEEVLEKYKLMDYNSLSIESITPSQAEPEYLVRLNFKQKDGSTGSKSIFIQFWNEDEIIIADHIKIDNITY